MSDKLPQRPRIKRDVVLREEDDGAFVFDPIEDTLRVVNETGALFFTVMDGTRTLEEITRDVADVFTDVGEENIREDAKRFMHDLALRGLLEEE